MGTAPVNLTCTHFDSLIIPRDARTHTDSQIPLRPEAMNSDLIFQIKHSVVHVLCLLPCHCILSFFPIHFPRVPPDSSAVWHCARELPVDCGGPSGGGAHQASRRTGPPSAGLQIVLPLPAAAHHPGCWLLPAHPPLHGEPGHDPDVCRCGDLVERLLRRGPALRCVSDPAGQSIGPPQPRAPALPAVWLHHLSCRSCCCASCV